ncbi:MAG: adenylate/guanylate cyclase domain-containing protein, partial [Clostridiales bacterium]|nr:adenylate/guanylate cyclase domain-containing protein [Clostridiales bacterium]
DESENPLVQTMMQSELSGEQITYQDGGAEYIGAFRKLSTGNGAVITAVKTSIILEGVRRQTVRNVYIMLAILMIALMVVYFFAKSLSRPLRLLTDIANEINRGNFNTKLFDELSLRRRDEIGVLSKSTINEREMLNMVSRLTNKGVTKAVITKEIDFEPHLKDVTIFFSDIRDFTAISDDFKNRFGERSAAEIIGFLNDYMSRMVTCITRTGGTVDKFEGDAIMAAWGVLRRDDLAWEQRGKHSMTCAVGQDAHDRYVREDALSAITCCIAMRYSLMKYNKDAAAFTEAHKHDPIAQYKPRIQIGTGLNSGRVTVGFMGSFDKMEFTAIGDAVNLASRTEASNKQCGTDILITEDTLALLKHDYIRCKENHFTLAPENEKYEIIVEQIPVEFEVKGKGKQHFYGVVNMPRFDIQEFFSPTDPSFAIDADCAHAVGPNGPKTLSEMRRLLGIAEPDFSQVNLNAEENKIQVANT